jgi:hypothetical protein
MRPNMFVGYGFRNIKLKPVNLCFFKPDYISSNKLTFLDLTSI